MSRFDDMHTFVAVAEAGSFTAAAERLKLAKSAVSRRISALESRLGVQLIRRTTRRLSLTDSGISFYQRSSRILADLDEAESAVAQQHDELRGPLRVALPLSFGLRHMHEPICDFSKRYPHVAFDLDFNDRHIDLVEEGLDVAVRIARLRDSTLIARKLFEVRTVVCASPDYLQRHGYPKVPADLGHHDCLLYSNLPRPGRLAFTNPDGSRNVVTVKASMVASSGDFLSHAASAGLGIVLLPTFIVHQGLREGRLVPLLTDHHWPVTPAHAVYPPTRHLSHRVRAFIDFLVNRFKRMPPWERDLAEAGLDLGPGSKMPA